MISQLDPMIVTSQNNYYVEKQSKINILKNQIKENEEEEGEKLY